MGFVLEPRVSARREIRRVARERLGDAIDRLDAVIALEATVDPAAAALLVEDTVHEVRKRCKEVRGLARLVRPALGDDFRPFDRDVRSAARHLSSFRDAHAVLATFDVLLDAQPDLDAAWAVDLRSVRGRQAERSADATAAIAGGDERLRRARRLLDRALDRSQHWKIPPGFDCLGDGLATTYQLGRHWWRRASQQPSDPRLHEWRKSVKYLWYQMRLLHDTAPSVIGPMVTSLDDLADALGDDHDLAVIVEQLTDAPERFGDPEAIAHSITLARTQQDELRRRAFRLGRTVYAEIDRAFVARVEKYWNNAVRHGPEFDVGGIAALAALRSGSGSDGGDDDRDIHGGSGVEIERKFAVDTIPADLDRSDSVPIRQGYLAIDGSVSVRVRDAGDDGCTLTVKWRRAADVSGERGELEWPISRDRFESVWPVTDGRRVVKTRSRIPFGDLTIELDVFHESLDGLVVAEVEFDDIDALASFTAPEWFGTELTDDRRYTNAALAVDGRPPD